MTKQEQMNQAAKGVTDNMIVSLMNQLQQCAAEIAGLRYELREAQETIAQLGDKVEPT